MVLIYTGPQFPLSPLVTESGNVSCLVSKTKGMVL